VGLIWVERDIVLPSIRCLLEEFRSIQPLRGPTPADQYLKRVPSLTPIDVAASPGNPTIQTLCTKQRPIDEGAIAQRATPDAGGRATLNPHQSLQDYRADVVDATSPSTTHMAEASTTACAIPGRAGSPSITVAMPARQNTTKPPGRTGRRPRTSVREPAGQKRVVTGLLQRKRQNRRVRSRG
jgi:hypothetical protein